MSANPSSSPLRLLDTAIEYRETEDRRVLLNLPAEKRELLESMLELSKEESEEAS